jgi:hypothetical protein
MTEEKIQQLETLLNKREILQNEIEVFDRMLKENKEDLGYQVFDWKGGNKDSCIHIIKDHYGYINEAMWKIQARYRRELAEVQKAIDEL